LDARLLELVVRAKRVSANAYCQYSGFRVGAAVLTGRGTIYAGCNWENASYQATCAERSAISAMIAGGELAVEAVVIYTPTPTASAPCGLCRQLIFEFNPLARIISVCDTDDRIDATLSDLLPFAFGPRNLDDGR